MSEHGSPKGVIRPMTDADFEGVRAVVAGEEFLLQYDSYVYWAMRHNAPELCKVYTVNGEVAAYATGIAPFEKPSACLLWQIGVRRDLRRGGVATALVDAFLTSAARLGFSEVQLTIDSRNEVSQHFFRRVAERSRAVAELANLGEIAGVTPREECWALRLA